MGFGPMFLGIMFLYDFQLGLRHPGAAEAYAMVDIFPDLVGWILLMIGLRALSRKTEGVQIPYRMTFLMLVLSLFTLAKDTLFFSTFYQNNAQLLAGEAVDFAVHLLELAFLVLLFRQTKTVCRKRGEDKLSYTHDTVPGIAYTEGAVYVLSFFSRLLPLPEGARGIVSVLSSLDLIFVVFLIWYCVIALFRTMRRIPD
ncbi:MAG: hypothetical protein IKC69_05130 [Clostridia bacterium]|nr:hypothetical protein [Clostridia bacterium]